MAHVTQASPSIREKLAFPVSGGEKLDNLRHPFKRGGNYSAVSWRKEVTFTMLIYEITVTDATKTGEFETFMLTDIFPGVPKSVSRLGQVDGLILLRGANTETSNQFIWMVGGVINKVPGDALSKIESFGAQVSTRNDWTESGRWVPDSTPPQAE